MSPAATMCQHHQQRRRNVRIPSVSTADMQQQHRHPKPHTASAMSDQHAIRQNIGHAVFERFGSIQIRCCYYEQSSPLRTGKDYGFRRRKASGRRTSPGFTALGATATERGG